MELAQAGIPLSFEITFDANDLPVAMTVYDDTGSAPVLLLSPFAMVLVYGNTYRGKFTAEAGKNYIIVKSVYTDFNYTDLSPDYIQGSESIVAMNLIAPVQSIVGVVNCGSH